MSSPGAEPTPVVEPVAESVLDVVRRFWGFDELRPLQAEAIRAGLDHRDSLVVMPTGGGKSLCYQVPPIVAGRTDVVVSPLISLMKDQVDGLRACGYPAAALHSGLTPDERRDVHDGLGEGRFRLLFVSPERLVSPGFMDQVERLSVRAFAVDEAHCISHWGHDFRPEYRQLATLKDRLPGASLHAFTATATPRVRQDIAQQLRLEDPNVLVGRFDRPNLTYRVLPRVDQPGQIIEVIRRHPREAVIVYCITRKETETVAQTLKANGIDAAAYHAGMDAAKRRRTQEAFAQERLDVVVATVAFGMGIDRSNVRCVIHAAMPKSVEHYQQETGRAGRDGLEAECVLLYSAADVLRWRSLVERGAENGEATPETLAAQLELLHHMQGLCGTLECRHAALSRYFGQPLDAETCGACDVCLDEVDSMPEATDVARKILSCVARLEQRWGVGHVVQVLRGSDSETIRRNGHETLSTFGLLRDVPEKALTNLVYQLVDQALLERTPGDRPVLKLNEGSVAVLRGERTVRLVEPRSGPVTRARAEVDSWEGVHDGLFDRLRELRRDRAQAEGLPAYHVFDDKALRSMARVRPAGLETFRGVRGVGEKKLAEYGPAFVEAIRAYCEEHGLDTDVGADVIVRPAKTRGMRTSREKEIALEMFEDGAGVDEVVEATGRTFRTVVGYLCDHIAARRPPEIDTWVPRPVRDRVAETARGLSSTRLKPIHDRLGGQVPYETIRVVLAHMEAESDEATERGESDEATERSESDEATERRSDEGFES